MSGPLIGIVGSAGAYGRWLQHFFQGGQHIVLGCESHFHIQLVELAGGTVGTGILITEAGCDLEISVKS